MKNLVRAVERMLDHYGFKKRPNGVRTIPGKVISTYNFPDFKRVKHKTLHKPWWICKNDHNYFRFTRILRCINLMGLNIYSEMIYQLLVALYEIYKDEISEENLKHWYCAAFKNDLYCNLDPDEINISNSKYYLEY